jgi:beta-lactamase regulating signal transducer with metallopeptidase domain
MCDGYELVVLPTVRLMAVTVPGDPPQVIVTRGLVSSLSTEQLQVVLRHEEAHLVERHDRYLLLAASVQAGLGWLPPVRRGVRELRLALERWADDEAAAATDDGRARVRDTLIQVGRTMLAARDLAAFSNADLLVDRLEALSARAPAPSAFRHALVYAPGFGLAMTSGAGLGMWIGQARVMLSMSGFCHV